MPKPRQAALYEQLAELSDDLDALLRETAGGIRSASRYDALEEEAQRIGKAIPAAFRATPDAVRQNTGSAA